MALKEIYVVGLTNSGKRTFLSLISHAASEDSRFEMSVRKGSGMVSGITSSLIRGKWPEDAEGDVSIDITYKKSFLKKTYRIYLKEIQNVNDKAGLYFSLKASGLVFVIDATKDSMKEEERLGVMIHNMKNILGREPMPPSLIAITKCDLKNIDTPKEWVEENYPIFLGEIKSKSPTWNVYSIQIYTENDLPARPLMADGPSMVLSWIAEKVR